MDKKKLVQIIENFAPLQLAEPWDCSGWLVETDKVDVNKVMFCLTVTDDVVKQAKAQNCDMIISHHPLFEINCHSELVSESMKPEIDIYCAHTNLDRTQGGTTDKLLETLNLTISEIGEDGFVRYSIYKTSVKDFAQKLCQISKNVRLVNNKNLTELNKIAFCAGSGSEFIKEAITNGADAYVTGDLKFHTAVESDIVLFDIGHFESEIPVLNVFKKLLQSEIEVVFAKEESPFKIIY
ncbi:MAG: Nif3-like dinuclear metal center hexameric protein [Cyanobacteria bacterium SIG32]|nr:Nif3-like dinuclear metal center hexameric protein [Cyanobacteria bacterium SIG32]